ncbi:MAG TPA: 2-dehydropantoate 2-reductase N-terminal domain-containing protein [Acidimicrobiales bacterium]|nr:2-dehydropantoate 2-reductase N-terminal domain-containing protein [Acidimicrobiales bacterium]
MRFVVFGAGAIGGVIGGRLFEHGYEVVLIARGAHHDAIRDHGLRLESPDAVVTLPVPVASHPGDLDFRTDDVVLLTMKGQDTAAAVADLVATAPSATPLVCVQNGVENERVALRSFPNVYGVCVMCPTTHLSAGVVQANSSPTTGILDVGRWPAGADDTSREVAAALRGSTFSSEAIADVARWKYAKLLTNLGNAIEAVCGPPARQGPLNGLANAEGKACLAAAGIDVASEEEDAARRGDLLRVRPIDGQRRGGGSSWQSLTRGVGSIETDYLNGEIVLLGRLTGTPTPINTALQRLANHMARDRIRPGSVSEEDVLRAAGLGTPAIEGLLA